MAIATDLDMVPDGKLPVDPGLNQSNTPDFVAPPDDADLMENGQRRDRSPTPVGQDQQKVGKRRRGLVKKYNVISDSEESPAPLDEEEGQKKKKKRKSSSENLIEKREGKRSKSESKIDCNASESEVNELWDVIASPDTEDNQEDVRIIADDSGSGGKSHKEKEGEEIEQFLKGSKKKKTEIYPEELALQVEWHMAQFEVAAEEDALLNMENQPAINKLKILPQLVEMLAKKTLQQEFLDHGILSVLRTWLEPLPDGSLPNVNLRTAILEILIELPINLENFERREQLRKSGLGKMIMFLSKSDEETRSNKKLALAIIDEWSRSIFNNRIRYEDAMDVNTASRQRTFAKKHVTKAARLDAMDDDFDLVANPKVARSLQITSGHQRAALPEKAPLDFLVRPPSKSGPTEIKRARKAAKDDRQTKIDKIFRRMRAGKRANPHALRVSATGRGMCTI